MDTGSRATKSGFGAEVQKKVNEKYDPNLAHEMLQWIASMTGESFNTDGSMANFQSVLKNGVLLAKLVNSLCPNSIPATKIKPSPITFKHMELIQLAMDKFKAMKIAESETFASVDLTEAVNLHQVCVCLQAVARKHGKGPKESQGQKREWTEEQLKAGQNIIGLQMGSNQGASQAGMNMGKQRMITNDEKF